MSLPSVACFRQMDIIDQLTALYEAILQISEGGSFSPDQILGLQAWYKDEGIVQDSGNVTAWNDSSGNERNLSPNSPPSYVPASLNGHDTVGFPGTSSVYLVDLAFSPSGTAKTIFLVANKNSATPDSGWYTVGIGSNHHPDGSGDITDAFFTDTPKSCGTEVVNIDNNWRIMSIRSQDGSYQMELDGEDQFSTNSNTYNSGSIFILGGGSFDGLDVGLNFQGEIAEVIVYDAYLSDSQRDAVLNYLRNRFGL